MFRVLNNERNWIIPQRLDLFDVVAAIDSSNHWRELENQMKCLPLKGRRWHWLRPFAAMPASIYNNRLLRLLITRTKRTAGSLRECASASGNFVTPVSISSSLTLPSCVSFNPDGIEERALAALEISVSMNLDRIRHLQLIKWEQLKMSYNRSAVSARCWELLRKAAC